MNGAGGTDGAAAISATKPGRRPVGNRSADGDMSQNGALAPVPPPTLWHRIAIAAGSQNSHILILITLHRSSHLYIANKLSIDIY
jgi:hypothetical protein